MRALLWSWWGCSLPWNRAGLRDCLGSHSTVNVGPSAGLCDTDVCAWNQPPCCEESPSSSRGERPRGEGPRGEGATRGGATWGGPRVEGDHVGRNQGPWPPAKWVLPPSCGAEASTVTEPCPPGRCMSKRTECSWVEPRSLGDLSGGDRELRARMKHLAWWEGAQ